MKKYIYLLCDPDTGAVRYVGATARPLKRLYQHRGHRGSVIVKPWLQGLRARDVWPVMEVLEETEDWCAAEAFYISYLRFLGFDLLNRASGGNLGYTQHAETKKIIGRKNSRPRTPEEKKKISEAQLGVPRRPEAIVNITKGMIARGKANKDAGVRWHTPEGLEKIREAGRRSAAARKQRRLAEG